MANEPQPSSSRSLYNKILDGGKLDTNSALEQSDFDATVQYIRKCFPKASKLQRDVDQTLTRTFVLEASEPKRKFLSKKKLIATKSRASRKMRLKKERIVPPVLKYDQFLQLNTMWKSYIADLLKDEERPEEIQQRLNRVDLHGAFITVTSANCCKDYLGLEGIVVKESRNVFTVVTSTGSTKTIPKRENMFDVPLEKPFGTLKIAGNSFLTRPAERSSKKMKSFMEFVGRKLYKSRLRYTFPE